MLDAVLGAAEAAVLVLVLMLWIVCRHPPIAHVLWTVVQGALRAIVLVGSVFALGYLAACLETRLALTDAGLQDVLFSEKPANVGPEETVVEFGLLGILIVLTLGLPIVLRQFSSDSRTGPVEDESRQGDVKGATER